MNWLWMRRNECDDCGGLDGDHEDDCDLDE